MEEMGCCIDVPMCFKMPSEIRVEGKGWRVEVRGHELARYDG